MNPDTLARLLNAARLLTDDELHAMLAVTATERDMQVARGAHTYARILSEIACACAQTRDERAALARSTDVAVNPFQAVPESRGATD